MGEMSEMSKTMLTHDSRQAMAMWLSPTHVPTLVQPRSRGAAQDNSPRRQPWGHEPHPESPPLRQPRMGRQRHPFAPPGLHVNDASGPLACARGYCLPPLRGWFLVTGVLAPWFESVCDLFSRAPPGMIPAKARIMDTISSQDREILRSLAGEVRQISELPVMQERKTLWYAHNALEPIRPMVLCYPEGSWPELLADTKLLCQNPMLRNWEHALRQKLYWWHHINDDNTIEPFFSISWQVKIGDYGVEIPYTRGDNRGSYVWEAPIKDIPRQLPNLHFRELSVDRPKTREILAIAQDLFGDLLPPRLRGRFWWTTGLTWEAIKLIGLEPLMLLMCDEPASIHQLMTFLRDEMLHFLAWIEREGLLSAHNLNDYTGSGGVGYTRELDDSDGRKKLSDLWGFAESQETVGVSPAMFEEFILPYQLPILEKFGLNCYGCCEPLHGRIDAVRKIPRLRRVSVSPWSNQEIMAEKLAGRAIFSRKPNPSIVCVSWDEQTIRTDLRTTLRHAGSGALEIILKDTHTVQNDPRRITRWVQIAKEEVETYLSGASPRPCTQGRSERK